MNKKNIEESFANISHNKKRLAWEDTLQPIQFLLQY